jgi:folate/biopterin transporter
MTAGRPRAESSDAGGGDLESPRAAGTPTGAAALAAAAAVAPSAPRAALAAVALVYLVQGLLGLSRLAVFVLFKDEMNLDPATVALLTGASAAPWVIKPLYGFLSDAIPLFGYRRRSYLAICGAASAASWAALGSGAATGSPGAALAALLVGSAATACADVVADSIVVELSRGEAQGGAGRLQSLCWGSAAAGGVASAYLSGSLVQDYGPRPVFWLTALCPLLVCAAAAVIPEKRVASGGGRLFFSTGGGDAGGGRPAGAQAAPSLRAAAGAQARALWAAASARHILLPTLFVFAWQATPSADSALLFFETNELGFSTEFLGRLRLVGALASLAGVGVYNFALREAPLRRVFLWTGLTGAALGLTQLALVTRTNLAWGISDELFALADSALLTALAQVAFMPVLVLAARLCPEGVEASLFAALMSILNAGGALGSAAGAGLTSALGVTATDFSRLPALVALCTLGGLAPLALLGLVPDDSPGGKSGKERE